jgi:hypothetical protein
VPPPNVVEPSLEALVAEHRTVDHVLRYPSARYIEDAPDGALPAVPQAVIGR